MCEEHLYGKPINIMKFTTDNKLVIDNSALDKIFLHSEVKTRKIAVISIIGAFRKGKSFFLNYCLRFMYANYKSIANPSNELKNKTGWMGPQEEPLNGFSWKSGVNRDTTGIIMWSDVFLHQNEFGEKLAIVLMVTQGLFDNETSPADNSRIFALGTLLSSVQILNLVNIIQEDHLQYLQFATEFARFAAKDNKDGNSKPFQKLLFLIRDWNNPDDFPFGTAGGRNYLETVLKIEDKQKPDLKSVRKFINASFETIDCCLMPHPGKTVATSKINDGCWGKMNEEFKEELENLIPKIFEPENLEFKKINEKYLTGLEMKDYFELNFTLFQSDTLPGAKAIYESTVESEMNNLVNNHIQIYKTNYCQNQDSMSEQNLHILHEMCKVSAVSQFKEEKKMGNAEHEEKYSKVLESQIENLFIELKEQNMKNFKNSEGAKRNLEELNKQKEELEKQKKLKQINKEKYELEKQLLVTKLELESKRKIEAEMNNLVKKHIQVYKTYLFKNQDFMSEQKLHILHEMSKVSAVNQFKEEKKMRNAKDKKKYSKIFEMRIEKTFIELKEQIEKKFKNSEEAKGNFYFFQSDLPKSIYESTVESEMNNLVKKHIQVYKTNLFKNQDLMSKQKLHILHEMSKVLAVSQFKEEKKIGNAEHEEKYSKVLEMQIENMYMEHKKQILIQIIESKESKRNLEELNRKLEKLEQQNHSYKIWISKMENEKLHIQKYSYLASMFLWWVTISVFHILKKALLAALYIL